MFVAGHAAAAPTLSSAELVAPQVRFPAFQTRGHARPLRNRLSGSPFLQPVPVGHSEGNARALQRSFDRCINFPLRNLKPWTGEANGKNIVSPRLLAVKASLPLGSPILAFPPRKPNFPLVCSSRICKRECVCIFFWNLPPLAEPESEERRKEAGYSVGASPPIVAIGSAWISSRLRANSDMSLRLSAAFSPFLTASIA